MKKQYLLFLFNIVFTVSLQATEKQSWIKANLSEEVLSFLASNDYTFIGIANPSTVPVTDDKVYYFAALPGGV